MRGLSKAHLRPKPAVAKISNAQESLGSRKSVDRVKADQEHIMTVLSRRQAAQRVGCRLLHRVRLALRRDLSAPH